MSLAAVLLLAAQTAPAPDGPGPMTGDWTAISQNQWMTLELDEASTTREGDRVRVRLRADMPQAPGGVRWGIAAMEFECGRWTARAASLTEYGADGSFRRRVPDADAAAAFAVPPSGEMRRFMEATCHRTGWHEEE